MVTANRAFLSHVLAIWLILCWPLVVLNGPAYFEDTPSYFKGGSVAVEFVADRLLPQASQSVQQGRMDAQPMEDNAELVRDTRGARSVAYSVLSYLLAGSGDRFVPLAIAQALLVAICLAAALGAANFVRPRQIWAVALTLGLATPVAWFACYAMPDIFAGLTILTMGLLLSQSLRFSWKLLLALSAIAVFAIASHASHIVLAGAMLVMGTVGALLKAAKGHRAAYRRLYWTFGATAVAVGTVIFTGLVGFGEISFAPKRYPFLLARAIEMGPGRDYLHGACKVRDYEVCKLFPGQLPSTSHEFLWDQKNGVVIVATPAQMDRLRGEEMEIVFRTIGAAPLDMAKAAFSGTIDQLMKIKLAGVGYGKGIRHLSPIELELVPGLAFPRQLIPVAEFLTACSTLLSIIAILAWLRVRNPQALLALLLIGGVVANAVICANLSTVADRYQARVIWLLPLAAFLLWAGRRELQLRGRSKIPAGVGDIEPLPA